MIARKTVRIGVLADTHIPGKALHIPDAVLRGLAGVEMILHAGDLTTLAVLDELRQVAPVRAVFGNVDPPDTRFRLPQKEIIQIGSWRIGLTHGDQGWESTPSRALRSFADDDVHVVVFGHSHQPLVEWRDGVLLFNPGSPTDRRRSPQPSYGLLHLGATVDGEVVYF